MGGEEKEEGEKMQLQKQSVKHKNPYCFVVALSALQLLGTDGAPPCSGSIHRGALGLQAPSLFSLSLAVNCAFVQRKNLAQCMLIYSQGGN